MRGVTGTGHKSRIKTRYAYARCGTVNHAGRHTRLLVSPHCKRIVASFLLNILTLAPISVPGNLGGGFAPPPPFFYAGKDLHLTQSRLRVDFPQMHGVSVYLFRHRICSQCRRHSLFASIKHDRRRIGGGWLESLSVAVSAIIKERSGVYEELVYL
jgi:hypothetical protein